MDLRNPPDRSSLDLMLHPEPGRCWRHEAPAVSTAELPDGRRVEVCDGCWEYR